MSSSLWMRIGNWFAWLVRALGRHVVAAVQEELTKMLLRWWLMVGGVNSTSLVQRHIEPFELFDSVNVSNEHIRSNNHSFVISISIPDQKRKK